MKIEAQVSKSRKSQSNRKKVCLVLNRHCIVILWYSLVLKYEVSLEYTEAILNIKNKAQNIKKQNIWNLGKHTTFKYSHFLNLHNSDSHT